MRRRFASTEDEDAEAGGEDDDEEDGQEEDEAVDRWRRHSSKQGRYRGRRDMCGGGGEL